MPKFKLATPFEQLSGALVSTFTGEGLIAFRSPTGGNVIRGYARPGTDPSPMQALMRQILGAKIDGWRSLTQDHRNAWRTQANRINRSNSLGLSYSLGGFDFYTMVNTYNHLQGFENQLNPPTSEPTNRPITIDQPTVKETTTPNEFFLDAVHTDLPEGSVVFMRTTRPDSSARGKPKWTALGMIESIDRTWNHFRYVADGVSTFESLKCQQYEIKIGDRIGVEIVPVAPDGMPGKRWRSELLTVGTRI